MLLIYSYLLTKRCLAVYFKNGYAPYFYSMMLATTAVSSLRFFTGLFFTV